MSEEGSKIIEKIRKLLRLAESSNEHEAALASERAAALLAQYNLTHADLNARDDEGFILDESIRTDSRPWRRNLAMQVARLYFCDYCFGFLYDRNTTRKAGYRREDVHSFVGRPHNVEVAKSVFKYLCATIERLAQAGANQYTTSTKRTSYKTSFRTACATRLTQRLAEKLYELSTPQGLEYERNTLPALYKTETEQASAFMQAKMPDVRPVEYDRSRIHSIAGAIDGNAAGESISLDTQIGNEKAKAFALEHKR